MRDAHVVPQRVPRDRRARQRAPLQSVRDAVMPLAIPRARDDDDARDDDEPAEQRGRPGPFAPERDSDKHRQQRSDAAREGVDDAEVGPVVGGLQPQLVDDVDDAGDDRRPQQRPRQRPPLGGEDGQPDRQPHDRRQHVVEPDEDVSVPHDAFRGDVPHGVQECCGQHESEARSAHEVLAITQVRAGADMRGADEGARRGEPIGSARRASPGREVVSPPCARRPCRRSARSARRS